MNKKLLTEEEKHLEILDAFEVFVDKLEKRYGRYINYNVNETVEMKKNSFSKVAKSGK